MNDVSPKNVPSLTTPFTISWYGNNSPTYYNLHIVGGNGIDKTLSNLSVTSWTGTAKDSGLTAGNYAVSAQACNAKGCSASYAGVVNFTITDQGTSQTTSNTTTTTTTNSTALAPTLAQINVSPTNITTAQNFTVSWSGNNSPTSYSVKIDNITIPEGTATTWTGTPSSLGLMSGTHTISSQACNASGCSPWTGPFIITVTDPVSAAVSVTATVPTVSAPTLAQINVSPTVMSQSTPFSVSWGGDNSPTSYSVKIDSITIPEGGVTTWTGTPSSLGLSIGQHTISSQACNSAGCSAWSGVFIINVTN
jgi:hypothetical protein